MKFARTQTGTLRVGVDEARPLGEERASFRRLLSGVGVKPRFPLEVPV